jgi:alanyl-tRNA synthetase
MAIEDARASGARALCSEKYGDEVRVVAMGNSSGNTLGWSVELCGGTHVRRTGDIGVISGLADSGVASGVRRLEALTGTAARKAAHHLGELAKAAAAELKAPLEEMPARLAHVLDERRRLERELSDARKKLAMGGGARSDAADGVRVVGDVKLSPARSRASTSRTCAVSPTKARTTRVRRGRPRRRHRRRQGRGRGRRHRRSDRALLRRRSRAQGWKRWAARAVAARHGAGRRSDGAKAEAALAAIAAALGG